MFEVESQEGVFFDDLTAVQYGWEFTADQLGPSEDISNVHLYRTSHVGLCKFRYHAPYDQRLRARENILTFGLLDSDNPATWSYDQLIPNDALVIFPNDDQLRAITPVGFRGSGIHLSEKYITNLAELVFRRPLQASVPASGIIPLDRQKLKLLRAEISKWQRLEAYSAESRPEIISRREESLALAIIDALFDESNADIVCSTKAQSFVTKALEIIHDSELDEISASELCAQTQCSQRTLEKGFCSRFGVTPKKYINGLRLARVHKGLRYFDAQDCDSIIELAGIQGFWHMGQFAADYRRIYGELPSDTLKRN
jgi:AraC family ethanolamine operon transcriptional activator